MQQVQIADLEAVPSGDLVIALVMSGTDVVAADKLVRSDIGWIVVTTSNYFVPPCGVATTEQMVEAYPTGLFLRYGRI